MTIIGTNIYLKEKWFWNKAQYLIFEIWWYVYRPSVNDFNKWKWRGQINL